jgi:hypothetical protein
MLIQIKGRELKGTLKEVVVTDIEKPFNYTGRMEFSWTATLDEPTHNLLFQWVSPYRKKKTFSLVKRLAARAIIRSSLYS